MRPRPYQRHPAHQLWLMAAQRQWTVPGAAARPDLRIGDAERTAVTEALQQHYAEGRLEPEELEERVGRALAAKTEGDLAEIVRDLPGPPPWRPAPDLAHRSRHPRHRHGPRFLWAPAMVFLLVLVPVSLIAGTPALLFVGLRVLLAFFLLGLLFRHLRRRRLR